MIMTLKLKLRNIVKLTIILIVLPNFNLAQSTISFCDGDNLFLVNEGDCNGGLNFGDRKPDCVCISGIYRSWTEDCGLYDGFTNEYCSPLWDPNEDDRYKVEGLRLIPGIGNIYKDTFAVFGENGTDFWSWRAIGMGTNGKTWSDTFYVLNGFPVVLMKPNDKFICVERAERKEKQICRYFASDNMGLWDGNEGIRILLMENCEVKGYTMAEMRAHRCYEIMNRNVSDCALTCQDGKISYVPGSLPTREKKSIDGGADGGGGDGGGDGAGGAGFGGDSMMGLLSPAMASPNGPPLQQNPASQNNNFFLHRRLNKFTRLRQTGQLGPPDLTQAAPNRTFALLDIAKKIVRGFCPSEFVSDLFLDMAVELFVVLHRGQDFRYIEDVPPRDFQWIREILLDCRSDKLEDKLREFSTKDENQDCKNENYIDRFSFLIQDMLTRIDLERGNYHQENKFHYVIDAVWMIVDLTHVLCYPNFERAYRMFHVWEQASEKLFTRDIRNLWFNPQVDLTVYNTLLSNRATLDMVNLDRCTEAAYYLFDLPELVRPMEPKSLFKRRRKRELFGKNERQSVAKSVDVYCAKEDAEVDYKC